MWEPLNYTVGTVTMRSQSTFLRLTLSIYNVSVIAPLSSLESFCVIKWDDVKTFDKLGSTEQIVMITRTSQVWYSNNKSYDLHSSLENSSFDQLDSWWTEAKTYSKSKSLNFSF